MGNVFALQNISSPTTKHLDSPGQIQRGGGKELVGGAAGWEWELWA